ncbi:MAG: DnaA regulatory inactivator Hda [Gammaproteobacteria bacterium]|nr:DnaA regulatory inactivator Hda [Gammaproteobacteria bacterium]
MIRSQSQLPLAIKLRDQAVFASYYAGPNAEIVDQLQHYPMAGGGVIWLWGDSATGKSHLLQAMCAEIAQSAYLPVAQIESTGPDMLRGFDRFQLVCLDDIDLMPGNRAFERSLFGLFQELVTERSGTLMVSSTRAPRELTVHLADLKSRLLSGPVYRLVRLSEHERLQAIKQRAQRRGLELTDETGEFLLRHFKRDMRSLCDLLDKLDTAALVQQQRRLTVPLLKSAIADPDH